MGGLLGGVLGGGLVGPKEKGREKWGELLGSSSVMNENGKAMSRQKVVFGTRHDQPVKIPATASLFGWNTFVRFARSKQQVRGDDQSPYQSWHSPLRWATSHAHEVAHLLEFL